MAPYGWDTDCRQYRKGGGCNDARLLSGVKHELAKLGFDRVLLTGGSAHIPAFRDDLVETFGQDRLEQRDAFTAVVHGLGVRAQPLWGDT